jgi:hypothetical protein
MLDDGSNAEILLQLRLDGPLSDRDQVHEPLSLEATFGNFISVMEKASVDSKINFDKATVVGCTDLETLKTATIRLMDNYTNIQNVLFGEISRMKNLTVANNMDILSNLQSMTKTKRMLQLAIAFKDHKDPIVVLDSLGNMMALDIDEENNLVQANKPDWLAQISLFKRGNNWAHGDQNKHNAIDRNQNRRKARFQHQAIKDEEHFSKVQLHKNKNRRMDD